MSIRLSCLIFPIWSQRVKVVYWAWGILIPIDASAKTDRILMNKSANVRVIVPEPVIVQPRFHIMPLHLEPNALVG